MTKTNNLIQEIEKTLRDNPDAFIKFKKVQRYLYESLPQMLKNIRNGTRIFFCQPCDFVFIEEAEPIKDCLELYDKKYSKFYGKMTLAKFRKARVELKKLAENFLKNNGVKSFYWEVDNKNFFDNSKIDW